jgi:hypothetical protein
MVQGYWDKIGGGMGQVMVQGYWDKTLSEYLTTHYKLPKARRHPPPSPPRGSERGGLGGP